MQRSTVLVPWADGLKFRAAARIIRAAQRHGASIVLRCGERTADARSIMGLVLLCASMGAPVMIEAEGGDERRAVKAVERVFVAGGED